MCDLSEDVERNGKLAFYLGSTQHTKGRASIILNLIAHTPHQGRFLLSRNTTTRTVPGVLRNFIGCESNRLCQCGYQAKWDSHIRNMAWTSGFGYHWHHQHG